MASSIDSVREARAAVEVARAAFTEAEVAYTRAVVDARLNGERVPVIAAAAGVTRQRVYQILAKTECKHPPERLYTGYSDGELWVACCHCGAVLR